jgi:enoyl-CoA hydratase/carnithine racemase
LSAATETTVVTVERQGAVAIIWLNRPDVLNAFSLAVNSALITALEEADQDETVGAMVLAGRGCAFSAGADRELLAQLEHAGRAQRVAALELGARVTHAMLHAETPIIAAVQGYAVGGGLSLALAADIVLAAEGTVFFIPEVELGVPYLWGSTPMLAASLGMHRARNLVLSCDRFGTQASPPVGQESKPLNRKEKRSAAAPKTTGH